MIGAFFIYTLWFVTAVIDYARYGYFWQLKEYRLRNMRDFLHTRSNVLQVYNVWGALRRRLRPQLTNKMKLILVCAIGVELVLLGTMLSWGMLVLLILLRFVTLSIAVGALYVPTLLAKQYYIRRATRMLARYPNLTVIGITGSYGKTTVKEFLAQVLATQYTVIKTPEHINTEIGIARFMLRTDFSRVDVFVVEMGAYKPGDIATICNMVHPRIGILTAINEQHLALFGTIRTTQHTKYELLRALPVDGLAVVNSDNQYCRELLDTLRTRVVTFGTDATQAPRYMVQHSTTDAHGIRFECDNTTYTAPLYGTHHAMNIAPVIAVAIELGMDVPSIQDAVHTLTSITLRTMQCGAATIIDDSYNSNPVGFRAALNVLAATAHGRRAVVVTRGMQELGSRSDALHKEIAQHIGTVAHTLILISPEHELALRAGLPSTVNVQQCFDAVSLERTLDTFRTQPVVVLLENRLFASTPAYLRAHTTP